MSKPDRPQNTSDAETIRKDAAGQFAKGDTIRDNNGVASAKPRDITHADDATAHKTPPGQKKPKKEWDLNYDEKDMNEGQWRG
ncbi:hypothetical protein [Rhizobium paknamense]|uniref:Uncharacterized protein n=1 Tax=Rhizobium paknamense TaxID=1206817 RepID=A0ABU0IKW8_9HYPH|nr:hypothetical protein [Rhizobium paknamense]MDQ0457839.1 hypothetical protein [Rhizobium paknamense]